MATAATAIAPYTPIPGMPARDALARAHGHIGLVENKVKKILNEHVALKGAIQRVGSTVVGRVVEASASASVGFMIGVVDGRFGGDKGHYAKWGIPLDVAVGVAGHGAGLAMMAFSDGHPLVTDALHSVGNAGFAAGTHRWGHELGVAWAQKAGVAPESSAAAPNNGVKGGTVYTVAHPK